MEASFIICMCLACLCQEKSTDDISAHYSLNQAFDISLLPKDQRQYRSWSVIHNSLAYKAWHLEHQALHILCWGTKVKLHGRQWEWANPNLKRERISNWVITENAILPVTCPIKTHFWVFFTANSQYEMSSKIYNTEK